MKDAEKFVLDLLGQSPHIPFEEIDELFTRLVDMAYDVDRSPEEQELADRKPLVGYLH
ncbi:hypothetical protein D3C79_1070490 [compost metagenome]